MCADFADHQKCQVDLGDARRIALARSPITSTVSAFTGVLRLARMSTMSMAVQAASAEAACPPPDPSDVDPVRRAPDPSGVEAVFAHPHVRAQAALPPASSRCAEAGAVAALTA
jgi:hypothetical protein